MGSPQDNGSQIGRIVVTEFEFGERIRLANELAVLAKQAIRQKPAVKEALADAFIGEVRQHGNLQHNGSIEVGTRLGGYVIAVSNNPLPKNESRGFTFYSDLVIQITHYVNGSIVETVMINPDTTPSCEFTYTADPFYVGESDTRNQPMLEEKNNPAAEAAIRQFIDRFTAAEI